MPGGNNAIMTFAGKLDFLPYGSIVGQFQMVDHSGTLFYGADPIHFNSFNSLEFDGVATRSPPTDVNRATFTASGSDKLGSVGPITFRITDKGEPGKGNEVIDILIQYLPGMSAKRHDTFFLPLTKYRN